MNSSSIILQHFEFFFERARLHVLSLPKSDPKKNWTFEYIIPTEFFFFYILIQAKIFSSLDEKSGFITVI